MKPVPLPPHITFLPIDYQSLPYALQVREAFFRVQPEVVVLELPGAFQSVLPMILQRLPVLHLLLGSVEGFSEKAYFCVDPTDARIEAFRLALDYDVPVVCADLPLGAFEESFIRLPDSLAVDKLLGEQGDAYLQLLSEHQPGSSTPLHRVRRFAESLHEHSGKRILFIAHATLLSPVLRCLERLGSGATFPPVSHQTSTSVQWHFFPMKPEHLTMALREIPAFVHLWETFRGDSMDSKRPSFPQLYRQLFNQVLQKAEEETKSVYSPGDRRTFFHFIRNLCLVRGKLRPGLVEWMEAAKGCLDDDFAAILLDHLLHYPPCGVDERGLDERARSKSFYHREGELVFKVEPLYPRPPLSTISFHFKRRRVASAQQKEQWKDEFWLLGDGGICTWPPESIREENFFELIRQKSLQQITEDHRQVEEFRSSIQDGLDLRETIRNWHQKKVYVKKERRPPGQVGAVVVIWEDKFLSDFTQWMVTLYSENEKESDIAFCATPMGEEIVGPQISLSYYHCILSIFPAQSIPNVWDSTMLREWGTCGRLLIAAGVLLSQEKFITVVAPQPPDSELRQFAKLHGKGLLYLPIQSFGSATRKSMRRFHVLSSRNARLWGGDYIDED
ncbi:MAG: hypothetical protein SFY68_03065 [Candidatus Sumerlaeia bacterium]|nr:hypothetical protein [Candidatus Sumerlaeia bacterium]